MQLRDRMTSGYSSRLFIAKSNSESSGEVAISASEEHHKQRTNPWHHKPPKHSIHDGIHRSNRNHQYQVELEVEVEVEVYLDLLLIKSAV